MTVWMDFNPLKYLGIGCDVAISVSDDIVFAFVLSGGYFMISVNLQFKDSKHTFLLYMRVYDLSGVLLPECEWSE